VRRPPPEEDPLAAALTFAADLPAGRAPDFWASDSRAALAALANFLRPGGLARELATRFVGSLLALLALLFLLLALLALPALLGLLALLAEPPRVVFFAMAFATLVTGLVLEGGLPPEGQSQPFPPKGRSPDDPRSRRLVERSAARRQRCSPRVRDSLER
jgi:hypothetical protein